MPETQKQDQNVSISAALLKEILAEARRPVKTEEEIAAQLQREEDRRQLGATLKAQEENKQRDRANCTHMRPNGSTTATFVQNLNFMYCQNCGDVIRFEDRPELFNRLYQLAI